MDSVCGDREHVAAQINLKAVPMRTAPMTRIQKAMEKKERFVPKYLWNDSEEEKNERKQIIYYNKKFNLLLHKFNLIYVATTIPTTS